MNAPPPREAFAGPPAPPGPEPPVDPSWSVLLDDPLFAVVAKSGNLPCHPSGRYRAHTLDALLRAAGWAAVHFVSRLDKGTTGLMLVAKSGYAHELMKRRQHTADFYREYLAVAEGIVTPASGTIDAPIGLEEGSSYRHSVRSDGAKSLTVYETLSVANGRTLLRLLPQTGRTHQLRVHMAHLGYPLTGDWLYGTRSDAIDRPALHSHRLVFQHPLTGEQLDLLSPLPNDMKALIMD